MAARLRRQAIRCNLLRRRALQRLACRKQIIHRLTARSAKGFPLLSLPQGSASYDGAEKFVNVPEVHIFPRPVDE
jgi:hypothetical protein